MRDGRAFELHEIETADGMVYNMTDNQARWLMSFSGFGHAPIGEQTERGYRQNGTTVIGRWLEERTVTLAYGVASCSRAKWWQDRQKLLDILRINRGDYVWLRHMRDDNTVREIQARYVEGAEFAPWDGSEHGARNISENLVFRCADPLWYGDTHEITTQLVIQHELVFPIVFPIVFASSAITIAEAIAYNNRALWRSWPEIEITGPCDGIFYRNATIGGGVSYNALVPANETILITLSETGAYIESSSGFDYNSYLLDTSSPLEGYIAPLPEVPSGINNVTLYVGAATVDTVATLRWRDRYVGV